SVSVGSFMSSRIGYRNTVTVWPGKRKASCAIQKPTNSHFSTINFPLSVIVSIERNRKMVRSSARCDPAEIITGEIDNYQRWSALSNRQVGLRKWYDGGFAGYRFAHAASSSGSSNRPHECHTSWRFVSSVNLIASEISDRPGL